MFQSRDLKPSPVKEVDFVGSKSLRMEEVNRSSVGMPGRVHDIKITSDFLYVGGEGPSKLCE